MSPCDEAMRRRRRRGCAVPGVREQVERDDVVVGVLLSPVADEVRADEPGGAGDEDLHAAIVRGSVLGLLLVLRRLRVFAAALRLVDLAPPALNRFGVGEVLHRLAAASERGERGAEVVLRVCLVGLAGSAERAEAAVARRTASALSPSLSAWVAWSVRATPSTAGGGGGRRRRRRLGRVDGRRRCGLVGGGLLVVPAAGEQRDEPGDDEHHGAATIAGSGTWARARQPSGCEHAVGAAPLRRIPVSASTNSLAEPKRASGSLARPRRKTGSSSPARPVGTSACTCAAASPVTLSDSNGRLPVSSSYATTPSA